MYNNSIICVHVYHISDRNLLWFIHARYIIGEDHHRNRIILCFFFYSPFTPFGFIRVYVITRWGKAVPTLYYAIRGCIIYCHSGLKQIKD